MTNIFESFKDFVFPYENYDKKYPLHTGEVTNFWLLLTMLEEGITFYQIALNTTKDEELRHVLQHGESLSKSTIQKLSKFMKNEGIPLTKPPLPKPNSDPNAVPQGVKQTEDEIANLISVKVAAEMTLLGQALAESMRNDAGQILLATFYELLKFGTSLKNMMLKRGWLKIPPYYFPSGAPGN
ncbi:DUF3231 family protein [Niallia sp. NCCP-28]|uniref:DUF3231 family protein n=1 Tax=Niallia sp. NCCP-28 TaxID=2934712 RepID=UPI0020882B87|nr:DUF3231 family protein [Niallia sp. NCCP-28]GKU82947.1 hypothetical protein NCCP28_23430 [Niallia sp. NCCP-28]